MRRLEAFLLGCVLAVLPASAGARFDAGVSGAVFDRVWSLVDRRYWDPAMKGVDWAALRDRYRPQAMAATSSRELYATLSQMLGQLGDSHVYATPPAERRFDQARDNKGDEIGLGFAAVAEDGKWWISSVVPGSPAARAGVRSGWRLVLVNGRAVDTDYHPDEGENVALILEDENGGRHQVSLRGARFASPPDERARQFPGDVLLLRMDDFDGGDDRWLVRQLTEVRPRAVILDLRENAGGSSAVLDRIAGAFFTQKRAVLRLIARREKTELTRGAGPGSFTGPLAVLVGPRTASAAEAFAALIEESGRGITLGERTAGSLTGGVHYALPDGGELSVAEFDIRTASGQRLEGRGFIPRHRVPGTLAQRTAGKDTVLDTALQLFRSAPVTP